MAKSDDGVNKSALIREFLKTSKRAKPRRVVEALAQQGVTVTTQFVSTVKSNAKHRKKKGRGKASGSATPGGNHRFSLTTLMQAKRLAAQLGGVAQAKQALDALAKLQ